MTKKSGQPEISKFNLEINRKIKNNMKGISTMTDVPFAKVWEEAAIMFLKTKGIFLKPNGEPVENQSTVSQQ